MRHVPDYLLPDSVDKEKIKSQAGPQKVYFKKKKYKPNKKNNNKNNLNYIYIYIYIFFFLHFN